MTVSHILECLRGGLVASCQPVRGGPLDQPHHVAALALATLAGGAVALRLEGLPDLTATRPLTTAPIVGLVKRDEPRTDVYITPLLSDVHDLADAGADIIAFDATMRERPVLVRDMIDAIHARGKLVMADCSTFDEGLAAWHAGADLVGSTLSGYTPHSPALSGPDLDLVRDLARAGVRVIAEGRLHTPEDAMDALSAGAYAVTVGSALTRVELMTKRFADALGARPVEA